MAKGGMAQKTSKEMMIRFRDREELYSSFIMKTSRAYFSNNMKFLESFHFSAEEIALNRQ